MPKTPSATISKKQKGGWTKLKESKKNKLKTSATQCSQNIVNMFSVKIQNQIKQSENDLLNTNLEESFHSQNTATLLPHCTEIVEPNAYPIDVEMHDTLSNIQVLALDSGKIVQNNINSRNVLQSTSLSKDQPPKQNNDTLDTTIAQINDLESNNFNNDQEMPSVSHNQNTAILLPRRAEVVELDTFLNDEEINVNNFNTEILFSLCSEHAIPKTSFPEDRPPNRKNDVAYAITEQTDDEPSVSCEIERNTPNSNDPSNLETFVGCETDRNIPVVPNLKNREVIFENPSLTIGMDRSNLSNLFDEFHYSNNLTNDMSERTLFRADDIDVVDATDVADTIDVANTTDVVDITDATNLDDIADFVQEKTEIGCFIKNGVSLSNTEKCKVMSELWKPPANYSFPSEKDGDYSRKFQTKWLVKFNFLCYSIIYEGVFCKYCVLFRDNPINFKYGILVTKPCKNMKKALEIFAKHSTMRYHKTAVMKATNIKSIVNKSSASISDQLDTQRSKTILTNREKLIPIIQTIRLCGRQMLPLRGHQDSGRILIEEPEHNDGVFRSLLRYRIEGGDTNLENQIKTSGSSSMYTSSVIQNEIIEIFGKIIQKKILNKSKSSKFFTVLADETTDIAQKEQFSLCIRYVDVTSDIKCLREDFIAFVPVTNLDGASLAATLEKSLENLGFNLENLRGQGYDGASAMKGKLNGVQAIIKDKFPKAIYTHCVSHCLNLCLSDAGTVIDIRNAFGVMKEVCSFFHMSAKRTNVLEECIKEMLPETTASRLKTFCQTRWVERHEAVFLFKKFFSVTISALEKISDNHSQESARKATNLHNSLCSFPLILCMVVLEKMLAYSYNLSLYLQLKEIDLSKAMEQIRLLISTLVLNRENDDYFHDEIYVHTIAIANSLNVDEKVPRLCGIQRYIPCTSFSTPEEYYKKKVYIPYSNFLENSLKERFIQHEKSIIG